jgi:hypothetical protein
MHGARCELPAVLPRLLFLALGLWLAPALGAQLVVDDTAEAGYGTDARRLARLTALGVDRLPWTPHPVAARWRWGVIAASPLPARAELSQNSGLPYGPLSDAAAWAGRGLNLQASAGLRLRAGALQARVAPLLWYAQNQSLRLIPTASATPPNPYVDPMRPRGIDLPQRWGDAAVTRLEPGESALWADWRGFRAAVTSEQRFIGPGLEHSLLLQGGAGGFPRVEVGTAPAGLKLPIGRGGGVLASGRLSQTPWAPQRRLGARHGSFIDLWWSPLREDRLLLGAARFYHRDWQGWRPQDLLVPFGSLFFDDQVNGDGADDNQLAMLYARLRLPEAGLEVFGEFGKNDRSNDERDLAVQADHNAAWLLGFTRAWRSDAAQWMLGGTAVGGRIAELDLLRPQATFYEHSPITQGHTQRGQLLGTPLLQGTGGAELRLDRYTAQDRRTLVLGTRALPHRNEWEANDAFRRTEWSATLEWLRALGRGQLLTRVGGVADIGRYTGNASAVSLHVAAGYIWRLP